MRVELPDIIAPAKFLLDASQTMNDEEYFEFCANNQDLRIERTSQGEIVMMPPCGGESDSRNTELVMQLAVWAKRDGRGRAFGPSVEFIHAIGQPKHHLLSRRLEPRETQDASGE